MSVFGFKYVSEETILRNNKSIDIKELKGKECVGSYECSNNESLVSAVLEFSLDEENVFVLQKSWLSEKSYEENSNKGMLDFWIEQGELEITRGNYVDYDSIVNWFVDNSEKYLINQINYDRNSSFILVKSLREKSFNMQAITQNYSTLSYPTKNFRELLTEGKVISNNSIILRWYLKNAYVDMDSKDNWVLTKGCFVESISGINAILNAHATIIDAYDSEPNLLEIKLKDLDSIPEVWYKGELMFENRLQEVKHAYKTTDNRKLGRQTIEITGFDIDGYRSNKYPSTDTIKHERNHR